MDKFEPMVHGIRTLGLPALLSFHTVAKLGGISAAADELRMAKSGVSRHVSQLESHFGVSLLERGARSVRLTPVGRKLDERIRSILAEIDLLQDIAQEESVGVSGQVTIAATPEFGGLIATELFPVLRERHPNLTLVMRPDYAFEDMQDPGTDLAFRVGTFKDDRLVALELGAFSRWLVATPATQAQYAPKSPADLVTLPCLTFRGDRPGGTWRFVKAGTEETVEVSGPIAVRSFGILQQLVRAGQGFANLPSFMVRDEIANQTLVRCLKDYDAPEYPVFLTFRPGARNIARVDSVIEIAKQVVPRLLQQ
ncbi:LysR family transcriptional regulator [Cognatiyoonia sp. IB215182]|uniref:LysR family transcriptional regulator n=1 Tax=Cognatiyoonia sp. IB215182 TaxID=3097353 RepID=UPI002A0EAA7B|nr:LysR family transcriptional regulator [Cognatiyoonia sp. IB215182]MDX8355722.1 LysR family transcriptional regulator [Cognatiyoonia sp. IB215182]